MSLPKLSASKLSLLNHDLDLVVRAWLKKGTIKNAPPIGKDAKEMQKWTKDLFKQGFALCWLQTWMKRNDDRKVASEGYWIGADVGPQHSFDEKLAKELFFFFKGEEIDTLVDFGCGMGNYVEFFKRNGLNAEGYDGNPDTPELTNNKCGVLDLSRPFRFCNKFDWVMSLEVGEHLPKQFENVFIENLHENNKYGILLSWAIRGQGGEGHYNEQNNDYIKSKFSELGYTCDIENEDKLRKASSYEWFKNTIMIFRKKEAFTETQNFLANLVCK
jgi:hypothetical protein